MITNVITIMNKTYQSIDCAKAMKRMFATSPMKPKLCIKPIDHYNCQLAEAHYKVKHEALVWSKIYLLHKACNKINDN